MNKKRNIKTITIWECQDCGNLFSKKEQCWCCVDTEGQYTGKHKAYEIKCLGTFRAIAPRGRNCGSKQIIRIRPSRKEEKT
jgi:hypothetical protein